MVETVKINDPPPIGKGIIPFQPWEHLRELHIAIEAHRLLQVLKARQVGITWFLSGYATHYAMFNEGANVLLLSKGEDEAKEMLARCALIYRELPEWLKQSLGPGGASVMTFPAMDSKIRALPATETAGRTETASLVICDEWDFHPYAELNYAAVKPTIDAGGKFIGVSTVDKQKINTFFKQMWRRGSESGFHQMFFNWGVRPGRDQAWYNDTKRGYPNIALWEQEYPTTAEEALAPSQGLCYFDVEALKQLLEVAREEVAGIYRQPVIARRYAAWIDPAGQGKDNHSLQIMDCQMGEMVVDFTNNLPRDLFAEGAHCILGLFKFPLLGIESNGVGEAMIDIIKALGYPMDKLCKHGANNEKLGVPTSRDFRWRILIDLAEGIRQGSTIVHSKQAVKECFSFLQTDKGHPEAAGGAKDDRVMAMAGAAWVAKQVVVNKKAETHAYARL
ncbi:hypothetical protein LCGC14_0498530 [marine sediment metagenome]|uniref:Terminase large subunit gp17-like C-terminal domain-containing protein n=1 Tax=marine sediment metagenome TaxID=412755 RepID=A0A0F9S9P8_9ZZZZ